MKTEPLYSSSPITKAETASPFLERFIPLVALAASLWIVFLINNLILGGRLTDHGIIPRRLSGLPGIMWAPFLHGSFRHIAANTVPLFVLGAIICSRGKGEFTLVTFGGILLAGILTWLIGRTAYHIGASGLVFTYFGYLASLAYFKRSIQTLFLSVICIVGYGGMLRGILPTTSGVSWEGHLAGLISGIALAWLISVKKQEN